MPNEESPVEVMDTSVDSGLQNGDGKPLEDVERMEVMEIPPEKTAEEFKNAGNVEYLKKNYEAAAELYSNAIDHHPIAAYYGNRAAAYVMLGQYPKALEDARRSTQIDPMFIKGYLREAKCQLALGEIAAAVHLYEKILEKDSGNPTALAEHKQAKHIQELLSKAEASYLKCDFRTVLYNMDRCIEMCPDCLKFKSLKAECLALLERYDESQKLASDILRLDGLCADAIYVRGICFYYTDSQDKAFQHFQQVLRLAPDHTKAREAYKKAKNLISKKEEGNKAFKKGKYDEATTLYSDGLLIDPLNKATNAKLYYNLATVKQKTGKLEEAITFCTEAIKLNDKYTNAYLKRGKCYMDLEQYKEAVREYENLYKFEKTNDVKMHLHKAKLELKKSKRKDYYKMLDIGKNATDDEIKKAYRKHALLHHPDRHSGAAEEVKKSEEKKFKEIGEAYAVLSDPKKKSLYDSGQDLDEINGGGSGFDSAGFDPNIIFQSFFANGGGGQRRRGGGAGHSAGGFPSDGFPGFPGGFSFQFG